MKCSLFFLAVLFLSFTLKAGIIKGVDPGYQVVSDEADDKIEAGYYIVEGKVLLAENGKIVKNVTIEIQNGQTVVSKNGYFELKIPITSYYVTFSHKTISDTYYENYKITEKRRIKIIVHAAKYKARKQQPAEKPVIYAYSPEALEFELNLKAKGELTFTYPLLPPNNTWKMKTRSNGNLMNKGKQEFPYLFWEANCNSPVLFEKEQDLITAQFVDRKNVLHYLDSSLTALNFNPKEKTDFITYWGPRLVQKEYCLIQFQLNGACSKFAEYEVKPEPDHFNRLYLLFTTLDKIPAGIKTQKQVLEPFSRNGFTLLEWGGVEIPLELLMPLN